MRLIGFDGGHSIYELGPSSDVILFFECLKTYAETSNPEENWNLLTDRLYRRYLKREQLDEALRLMRLAGEAFALLTSKQAVNWKELVEGDANRSRLNLESLTMFDLFESYFSKFEKSCASAESFFETFNIWQPVRIVISDLSGYARDKHKPLEEYDALDGKPFWLR